MAERRKQRQRGKQFEGKGMNHRQNKENPNMWQIKNWNKEIGDLKLQLPVNTTQIYYTTQISNKGIYAIQSSKN